MVLVVSFVLDGRIDGRIDGMVFGYVFPLFRARRYAGRRGLCMKERSMSVADDRMVEREFYYSYIDLCLVSYLGRTSSK